MHLYARAATCTCTDPRQSDSPAKTHCAAVTRDVSVSRSQNASAQDDTCPRQHNPECVFYVTVENGKPVVSCIGTTKRELGLRHVVFVTVEKGSYNACINPDLVSWFSLQVV